MGKYNCTGCRVGNKFEIHVDKRGFVMYTKCAECGKEIKSLSVKDAIKYEDNTRRGKGRSDSEPWCL